MLKLGKDETFFELLESQAKIAVRAAETFAELVGDFSNVQALTKTLQALENEGDEVTHKLQHKLSGAFITPLDHEDFSELSHLLDDVTDCIEAVGARIEMYRLKDGRPDLVPYAVNLLAATRLVAETMSEVHHHFPKSAELPDILVQIHTLENENDVLYRAALTKLFDEAKDPIELLKWKEVYDRVEFATDRCESIAKVVDNMIVKYA